MTKNMFIVILTLSILALGLAFNFDGFRVLSVLAFMLALDVQIIMAYRAIRARKLLEKINEPK